MELILRAFPTLTDLQKEQFAMLDGFYRDWNEKINVISRKDIDNLYLHHVLHSLAVGKIVQFKSFTRILDIGTGGGFPGIPLAILFPDARFHLIDGTGKKIKVVEEAVKALQLENVVAEHLRTEQLHGKNYDFVVARGVTRLAQLYEWAQRLIIEENESYNKLKNGLIAFKGGDMSDEIQELGKRVKIFPISDLFHQDYFLEKYLVHVRI